MFIHKYTTVFIIRVGYLYCKIIVFVDIPLSILKKKKKKKKKLATFLVLLIKRKKTSANLAYT